jgi:hypothetical protein
MRASGPNVSTIARHIRTAKPAAVKPSRFSHACAAPKSAFTTTLQARTCLAYASEMAWRKNNRRVSNGEQYLMAADAALQHPVSRQWKGYWQRCG